MPHISPSDYSLCQFLPMCITLREILYIFSILHVFHTSSHLPDHHANSSSSLVAIQGSLASMVVILSIFFFSISQNYLSSLAITTNHFFCLLWLLSPFLHVTYGGDHMPIQKVLRFIFLASTSSLFSNMTLGD
jgi:hypothetical protein